MFDIGVPASFKDIQESDDITVNVCMGIDQGIPYPGLRSKIYHNLKMFMSKKLGNERSVFEASFKKGKVFALFNLR